MKLRALVESLDDVPEQFRSLYTKTEEGHVLDLDDKDFKSKIDEFRGNNRKQKKDLEALQGTLDKYKDVDPEKYREAQEKLKKIEEKKLLDEGEFDKLFTRKTQELKDDYEKRLKQLSEKQSATQEELEEKTSRLSRLRLRSEIQPIVESVGRVRPGAWDDIYARAERTWKYNSKSDDFDPMEAGEVKFGKKGEPLTKVEWAQDLLESAGYFFDGAVGGGAPGSRKATPGKRQIGTDMVEIGRNAEAILKGDVEVRL